MRGPRRCLRPQAILRVTLHDARPPIYSFQQLAAASTGRAQTCQTRGLRTSKTAWSANAPKAPAKRRGSSKLYESADEAVADVQSGSTILSSGFGLCGVAGKPAYTVNMPVGLC